MLKINLIKILKIKNFIILRKMLMTVLLMIVMKNMSQRKRIVDKRKNTNKNRKRLIKIGAATINWMY